MKLQSQSPPRPMTHDLLSDMLEQLEAQVVRITVTELRENTFYAQITVQQDGREIEVDSRPSDAIALAIRAEAPIFAADRVIEESAIEFEGEDVDQEVLDAEVAKFRHFLDEVTPEDFAVENGDDDVARSARRRASASAVERGVHEHARDRAASSVAQIGKADPERHEDELRLDEPVPHTERDPDHAGSTATGRTRAAATAPPRGRSAPRRSARFRRAGRGSLRTQRRAPTPSASASVPARWPGCGSAGARRGSRRHRIPTDTARSRSAPRARSACATPEDRARSYAITGTTPRNDKSTTSPGVKALKLYRPGFISPPKQDSSEEARRRRRSSTATEPNEQRPSVKSVLCTRHGSRRIGFRSCATWLQKRRTQRSTRRTTRLSNEWSMRAAPTSLRSSTRRSSNRTCRGNSSQRPTRGAQRKQAAEGRFGSNTQLLARRRRGREARSPSGGLRQRPGRFTSAPTS